MFTFTNKIFRRKNFNFCAVTYLQSRMSIINKITLLLQILLVRKKCQFFPVRSEKSQAYLEPNRTSTTFDVHLCSKYVSENLTQLRFKEARKIYSACIGFIFIDYEKYISLY